MISRSPALALTAWPSSTSALGSRRRPDVSCASRRSSITRRSISWRHISPRVFQPRARESRSWTHFAGRAGDIEFRGLRIDSMRIIDLCLGLEARLGREVEIEELIENPTLRRLADHFAGA